MRYITSPVLKYIIFKVFIRSILDAVLTSSNLTSVKKISKYAFNVTHSNTLFYPRTRIFVNNSNFYYYVISYHLGFVIKYDENGEFLSKQDLNLHLHSILIVGNSFYFYKYSTTLILMDSNFSNIKSLLFAPEYIEHDKSTDLIYAATQTISQCLRS